MNIIKIGGAVLKEADKFCELSDFLLNSNDKSIVVVSALGKTTRNLASAADIAVNDINAALKISAQIYDYHKQIIMQLSENIPNKSEMLIKIDRITEYINNILTGISITRHYSPKIKDKLLSCGEEMSLALASGFLQNHIHNLAVVNSKDYLITDNNFGVAKPNYDITRTRINDIISKLSYDVIITQGFVGSTVNNEITTMGMESSNLTAALLCAATKAEELIIITDVDGIYSIDPKIYSNAVAVQSLSYQTASLLANYGLKLLYPGMISLLSEHNFVLSYRKLSASGSTVISANTTNSPTPIFVISKASDNINSFADRLQLPDNIALEYIFAANLSYNQFIEITKYCNEIPLRSYYDSCSEFALLVFDQSVQDIAIALHRKLIDEQ